MIYISMTPDQRAITWGNEHWAKKSGREYAAFEALPDGTGILKTDLKTLWWEEPPAPEPPPPHKDTPIELEQQHLTEMEQDLIAVSQTVTDSELSTIEQGQAQTDLEIMILGG